MADPLAKFLSAKQAGIGIQNQQLGLQRSQGLQQQEQRAQGISIESQRVKFLNNAGRALLQIPEDQRVQAFQRFEPLAEKVGIEQGTFTPERMTDESLNQLISTTDEFIRDPSKLTAKQREFQSMTEGFSEEDELSSRRMEAGLEPREQGSGALTIARTPGATQQVAGSQTIIKSDVARGVEVAKLETKLEIEPKIRAAIKLAEAEASERGEVLTDLKRMDAALPGLKESVEELRELSALATSTIGGKVFDFAVKESGFGSTKGATAKAKFIAIIDNQVLPLLKPTFGAAFTVPEGESLKKTMGDPEASPEAKMAQLDAFMAQKERDVRGKEKQLGIERDQNQAVIDEARAAIEAGAPREAVLQRLQEMGIEGGI